MANFKINVKRMRLTWLGVCAYYFASHKKTIATQNIYKIFGATLNEEEKKRFIMAFYSHVFTTIKELFLLFIFSKRRLYKRIEIRGAEYFLSAAEKGRGVLLLGGHFGNWEFAGVLAAAQSKDFKGRFHCIRKSLRLRWLEKILFLSCQKAGINIIKSENAIKSVGMALKKNDAVLFLMDQRVHKKSYAGVVTQFLGQNASTHKSLAYFAEKYKSPVVPLIFYREGKHKHVAEYFKEIEWQTYLERKTSLIKNTEAYVSVLEDALLQNPEQWIWNYKRWNI